MTHSIPDSSAVALTTELGTVLITGDYKFDQTPVDGPPADVVAARRTRTRGRAAALRRLDQRRSSRVLAVGVGRRTGARGGLRALRGADRRHQLRVQHPPCAAGRRRRRGARTQGRARRALDAQERRTSAASSATSRSPRGCSSARARSRTSPTTGWSSSRPAPRASRCRRCAGWPTATTAGPAARG